MRNKIFYILILVLSFGLSSISAQTPTVPKTISGGVLNGKATSLPKPSFPAARAVNASGAVNVQVTIDENGDVISASAVSGHPLLRQVSEQAARASKFSPTKLEGQPVKITGVIVYNFVLPMTFIQIGYELSFAEKTQSLSKYQLNLIKGTFPQTWEEEKEAVKKIDALLIDKTVKEKTPPKPAVVNSNASPENRGTEGSVKTVQGDRAVFVGSISTDEKYLLDNASAAAVRELQSKLESRLSVNENIIWSFRLGTVLGKLKAEIDSDEKTQANVSELNQLNANKPAGISQPVAAQLKELIEASEQATSELERTKKLLPLIESLRNLRGF
jgi:TonB family protein